MDECQGLLEEGRRLHLAGRLHEAEQIYRRILSANPRHAEAWQLLGMVAHASGRSLVAIELIERAITFAPDNAQLHYNLGFVRQAIGQPEAAAADFRRAIALSPAFAPAHFELARSLSALGQSEGALAQFQETVRLSPDSSPARLECVRLLRNSKRWQEAEAACREWLERQPQSGTAELELSRVLRGSGQIEAADQCLERARLHQPRHPSLLNDLGIENALLERNDVAEACLEEAIRLKPGYAMAYNNLGNVRKRQGRMREAGEAYLMAIQSDPGEADFQLNLGQLLQDEGNLQEALVRFSSAVQLQPQRPDAQRSLALVLWLLGRNAEALEAARKSTELAPRDLRAGHNLARILHDLGQYSEAEAEYRRLIEIDPRYAAARANLAYLLADQGRVDEARENYRAAYELSPSPRLRLVADVILPPIYRSQEEIRSCRARLESNLAALDADGVRIDTTAEVMPTLFYLAYHGSYDRDIQSQLTRLAIQSNPPRIRPRPRVDARIRVGFLSKNLKNHTIGGLWAGLIEGISRDEFEVTFLAAGHCEDRTARRIRARADRYFILPHDVPAALGIVAAQDLDVLIYPDIGMEPFTFTLAFSRLAPVQCVTWGHPATTGIPAMDYFLSSEDLETPGSDANYTEQLVRFRRLMVCYDRPSLPKQVKSREDFGLPSSAHLYACPQTLFKFHPDFDELLARILQADPQGVLVLLEGRYRIWRETLWRRFETSLGELRERIRVLPTLAREDYLNLLAVTDVLLDPIHFGGGNSSYEGLAMGTPIVTLPSDQLRGRITYALYRQMDLDECIASTPDDYVRLALELGTDPAKREAVRERILESGDRIFGDREAIRELERFLRDAVTAAQSS